MTPFVESVLATIKAALPDSSVPVRLHEPEFSGREWEYVKDCIDTGWVSTAGQYVERFENQIKDFTGAPYAIACVNGTAALHAALLVTGVGHGHEVLLPALTFVAPANAISYCGAIPHFVDSEMKTLGMDADKLDRYLTEVTIAKDGACYNRATGRKIKTLVPMHTFGHPADLDALAEVCKKFNLTMIEDASESLGSFYKGKHTGLWGLMATVSFNGNKIVTSGGGGAILTSSAPLAKKLKHITTTAKVPHPWEFYHDEIGYNYRLPNINAALGCAQLEHLPLFLEKKRALADRYEKAFAKVSGVTWLKEPSFAKSNYWLNAILLDDKNADQRDTLLRACHDQQYLVRPTWKLMHKLPMFSSFPRMDVSVAEKIEKALINLPSSSKLMRHKP